MYEKGNVSIREEKKIPRMFHSRSHFVLKIGLVLRESRYCILVSVVFVGYYYEAQ